VSGRRFAALVLLLLAPALRAEQLMMVRAERPFPEAMNLLQQTIQDRGYQVTRVQRVDVGLESRGFRTAEYRVVFFGKAEEIIRLPERHPDLIPYLPLKIVIFAEGDTTLALTYNPMMLTAAYPDADLQTQFRRWERDLRAILDRFAHER
jgi:uncharacterized protein (DUF302 family)